MNFLAVRGQGDPNQEGGAYQQAIGLLYGVAFTLNLRPCAGGEGRLPPRNFLQKKQQNLSLFLVRCAILSLELQACPGALAQMPAVKMACTEAQDDLRLCYIGRHDNEAGYDSDFGPGQ